MFLESIINGTLYFFSNWTLILSPIIYYLFFNVFIITLAKNDERTVLTFFMPLLNIIFLWFLLIYLTPFKALAEVLDINKFLLLTISFSLLVLLATTLSRLIPILGNLLISSIGCNIFYVLIWFFHTILKYIGSKSDIANGLLSHIKDFNRTPLDWDLLVICVLFLSVIYYFPKAVINSITFLISKIRNVNFNIVLERQEKTNEKIELITSIYTSFWLFTIYCFYILS